MSRSDPRVIAVRVLGRVERDGAFANRALDAALPPALPARDRSLATRLVYGTLRWRALLDHHLLARLIGD